MVIYSPEDRVRKSYSYMHAYLHNGFEISFQIEIFTSCIHFPTFGSRQYSANNQELILKSRKRPVIISKLAELKTISNLQSPET